MGKKATGIESKPPSRKERRERRAEKRANRPMKLPGLNKRQRIGITQRQNAGNELGGFANEMLPDIQEAYSQPFDWNAHPNAPVTGDFNAWRDQQIQLGNQAFDTRFNPIFAQQNEDFEQTMANRGIPMGSELYNREKSRMEQSQSDARQQGYFQAAQTAGQNAGQFFDIGTQARGNSISEAMARRNMPLNEFQQLYGADPGFAQQNLQFSQQKQLQSQAEAAAQQLQNTAWHPSPAGGGGPGPSVWQQYGYGTPQEYDAYQDARARANADYAAGKQPKPPNQYAGIAGGILGAVGGGLASGWASTW